MLLSGKKIAKFKKEMDGFASRLTTAIWKGNVVEVPPHKWKSRFYWIVTAAKATHGVARDLNH
jgi:hypothetical protein